MPLENSKKLRAAYNKLKRDEVKSKRRVTDQLLEEDLRAKYSDASNPLQPASLGMKIVGYFK